MFLELKYCEENPDTCKNGAKCISLTKDDGNYRCLCREGTSGRNCEYSEIHTVKPAAMKPAIIPLIENTETSTPNNTITEKEETPLNGTTIESTTVFTTTTKKEPVISEKET